MRSAVRTIELKPRSDIGHASQVRKGASGAIDDLYGFRVCYVCHCLPSTENCRCGWRTAAASCFGLALLARQQSDRPGVTMINRARGNALPRHAARGILRRSMRCRAGRGC